MEGLLSTGPTPSSYDMVIGQGRGIKSTPDGGELTTSLLVSAMFL